MSDRTRLVVAAHRIAARQGVRPSGPWTALRKLVVQERRDRTRPGSPVVGWKRGEIFEVLLARTPEERLEEIGDCGYYLAQSFSVLWRIYALIVPTAVIAAAVEKFERRASK